MVLKRFAALAFAVVTATTALAQEVPRIPAFPEAEGFGMFTQGGRGGVVYLVTNLEDYGSDEPPIDGSLRYGIEQEGPRTILFRTSGNIALKRPLTISNSHLTIAGQSAPGDGVAITNYGIDIDAPEVIIRYLRVRPGDVAGEELDAINVRSSNVVIDHCSASWATDETVSIIGDATDVTVQWCLIAESLNESVHSKGEHGYGSLISTSGRVSMHHNAYVLHKSRNPRPRNGLLDFRNNVIYGWGDRAGYNADDRTRMNYVANYLYPLSYTANDAYAFILGGADTRLYLEGNVLRSQKGELFDDWGMIRPPDGLTSGRLDEVVGVDRPFPAPSVTTQSAPEAFGLVLREAGATRPRRDGVDQRIVRLMHEGRGQIIDSQEEVGGWPQMHRGRVPDDTDRDGLPDTWENTYGLNPTATVDQAADLDADGYTNVEEFLNGTDPTEPFAWVTPPAIRPASAMAFTVVPLVVTFTPSRPGLPVYYTTDGSEPTPESSTYETPLMIRSDAHVRAKTILKDHPTTAAFAAYDHLKWVEPDVVGREVVDGLEYSVFEADDWDEGAEVENLRPVKRGVTAGIDFSLHGDEGGSGVVFEGLIDVPRDGIYSFHLADDARSELWIAGEFVTHGGPEGAEAGQIALRKGLHAFNLRSLHEEPREAVLEWSGPGFEREPIDPVLLKRRDT